MRYLLPGHVLGKFVRYVCYTYGCPNFRLRFAGFGMLDSVNRIRVV
jgi:hypothetical protein